jgi:uroporphyrinogen decarboxylase
VSDLFLRALREEPVERIPVWIMRQAGRYLPEYRAVRAKVDFLTLCRTPALAAEVTRQPVEILGVDAAILFSDILVPLLPLIPGLRFDPGPRIPEPLKHPDEVRDYDPAEEVGYVGEAIRLLRGSLKVPLIGFAGAPWTLATYACDIRRLRSEDAGRARAILDRLERLTTRYLLFQVASGAQAVQLFDSWGGELSETEFERFAAPGLRRICSSVRAKGVPVIYFAKGPIRSVGATARGVDWTVDLAEARKLGPVQGNLDPTRLLADPSEVERAAKEMATPLAATGYVANLGHGILPETPVECAKAFVSAIQSIPCRR